MLFKPPMYHQNNEKQFVFLPFSLCIFICIVCTHCVYLHFIYLYLFTNAWPILESEGINALFEAYFLEKGHFFLLSLPKQMPFLNISNKIIFLKTQSNILGAIVVSNKLLE